MAGETRVKVLAQNTYRITCMICKTEHIFYGQLYEYKYKLSFYYVNKNGHHEVRKGYACSWSCYIKGLLESTANKKSLDDNDVLLLLKYKRPVPWDRISQAAIRSLPSRQALEEMYD